MASTNINTLTAFSGADLIVSFANQVIGELQKISWSIEREKKPVYTLGSPDARSFSSGKREIKGSLVFAMFDQDSLIKSMKSILKSSESTVFTTSGTLAITEEENFINAVEMLKWNVTAQDAMNMNSKSKYNENNSRVSDDNFKVPNGFSPIRDNRIVYLDSLPPFDITMTFGNEQGQCAFQKIYDVDIVDESSEVSIDTIVLEKKLNYRARKISPLIQGVYSKDEK
ncbi:major structural protein [Clostridioides difficile]|nr:major structural protein [Clostridioides difficile]